MDKPCLCGRPASGKTLGIQVLREHLADLAQRRKDLVLKSIEDPRFLADLHDLTQQEAEVRDELSRATYASIPRP